MVNKKDSKKKHNFLHGEFHLPKLEEKILDVWRTNKIFEKSLNNRKRGKEFVFYEGPPYANGKPGIHHVLARAFKDIILRYKTMRGFYVPRRAGWDTHGLPTEIAVEKELGIKNKREIEKFGIDLFNQKARESVWGFKEEWEKMTERIGYWLDMEHAYITYTNDYIETLWWIFKRVSARGFLKRSYKVVPYCSRCATPLASHELGMPDVYKKVKDPSVYIKFRLKNGKSKHEYFLIWTTTPWTLPSNLFIAVNPELTYTKYKVGNDFLWSYNPPPQRNGNEMEVVEKISGHKLLGLKYEPLYKQQKVKSGMAHKIVAADFVSTEDGTGLVHIAPAFGEDDFNLSAKLKYPIENIPITVDDEGRVVAGLPGAGKFIKVADPDIVADLEKRELMHLAAFAEHEYPFCWRCGTALIYFARRAWFFEMSKLRKELVLNNKKINWVPDYLKEGRFGEWIRDAKDWAISRERYWGAPLPIWHCDSCEAYQVLGSLDELRDKAVVRNTFFFMRHGEAMSNVDGLCGPSRDTPGYTSRLTEKGKKQAELTAKVLAKKNIDIIVASPLARTKETAIIIKRATSAEVVYDEGLLEINPGILHGHKAKEYHAYFKNQMERFSKAIPGGESWNEARRRMFAAFRRIDAKYSGKRILIISHGHPLWLLRSALNGIEDEAQFSQPYPQTGILYEVNYRPLPLDRDGKLDFHRPYIDEIKLKCESCRKNTSRVKEVADVWFDSGAMPFAQNHFPFAQKLKTSAPTLSAVKKSISFPADYICEAIDQTRGWFYLLLATSTLLGYGEPYKNVVSLGLIMDKFGKKMSKSKGNVVNPWEIIEKYGVDAVRWYFYTISPPGEPKNFDENEVLKAFRRFHLILYNVSVFWRTYAVKSTENILSKNILDRWILERLAHAIQKVTTSLEVYEIREAALELEAFTDDLSRWYVRRSRRRFQKPESLRDRAAASATLGHVLLELAKLIAPFSPFFGDALYESMGGKDESVHIADWPKTGKKIDDKFLEEMAEIRRFASLGLAKRAELGIKVRQPLAELKIKSDRLKGKKGLLEILADEVNVKKAETHTKLSSEIELDTQITPELKEEGMLREIVRMVQDLRQKASLEPKDRIFFFVQAPETMLEIMMRNDVFLKKETNAAGIQHKKSDKLGAESETKTDTGEPLWLGIRRI